MANTGGNFDQAFDQPNHPLNRSNTQHNNSNRDLGGTHLYKDRSIDRLTTADPIAEENYHKTIPNSVKGNGTLKRMNSSGHHLEIGHSGKLEDSVAAPDRLPIRVEGLTAFLRKEYLRVVGIFIKKSEKEGDSHQAS